MDNSHWLKKVYEDDFWNTHNDIYSHLQYSHNMNLEKRILESPIFHFKLLNSKLLRYTHYEGQNVFLSDTV